MTQSERGHKHYELMKKLGKCTACGEWLDEGEMLTTCQTCRDKRKAKYDATHPKKESRRPGSYNYAKYHRDTYIFLKERGICQDCKEKLIEADKKRGHVRCQTCRDKRKEDILQKRKAKREQEALLVAQA